MLAVIAALVVGVPATLWVVGKVAYAPEEPVEDLVAAFNDGDAARAGRLPPAALVAAVRRGRARRELQAPRHVSIERHDRRRRQPGRGRHPDPDTLAGTAEPC